MDRSPLPLTPVAYHQLLRGPRRRWWRPLLSLLVATGLVGVLFALVFGVFDGLDALLPDRVVGGLDDELSPLSTLELDLALASLIPVAGLAVWVTHRVRPRWVSSVAGGLRWRWLGRCLLVTLPVWVAYMVVGSLLDPVTPGRPDRWVLLLVMAVVITPFQAAGEEYFFRGWLVQNVSAFFGRPVVALVASTLVSATLFGLAHGSFDPWVFGSIATLAVAACLANWRTGGLEAGIAMHVVNNVCVGVVTISYGGYADSFVSGDTTGSPVDLAVGLVVHGIAVALILDQGRRTRVQRLFAPPVAEPAVWEPTVPARPAEATWYAPLGR